MKRVKEKLTLTPRAKTKTPSSPMHIVAGLRNPGSEYEGTRHNVGFEVASRVLERAGEKWGRAPSRLRAGSSQVGVGDARVVYLAPATFMNDSGSSVRAALDYYSLDPEALLVVHDDIDLPFGRLRVQVGGGSGGHNGIRSIERSLGSKDFSRLKIGVGRPPGSMDPANFVLRDFTKSERPDVELMVEDAAEVVELWAADRARSQEMAALRDGG